MEQIRDLAEVNAELQEKKSQQDTVDFKMITFRLAGKDYGVDIMSVKEIAKADKYTFVPNAPSFVRGVYNLRGDIIPVIDLRVFFHQPQPKSDGQDSMLILHIEDRVYGTIVDKIDKVVGINSSQIQPPHPIFGDINIKYIEGVVEKSGDLYIILDVVRIFGSQGRSEEDAEPRGVERAASASRYIEAPSEKTGLSGEDLGFIKDQLAALKSFYASPVNEDWIALRLADWSKMHSGEEVQLKAPSEAASYLEPFFSPFSNAFWSDEFAYALKALLPDLASNNIQVWNPGCGKGYETYSLACILKLRYPSGRIKIWANDSDIMSIANAPNMTFDENEVPEYCRTFLSKAKTGFAFNSQIKDSIVFEYHDITNENTLPDLDIVFCRDVLSFLKPANQERIIGEISEKLKDKGAVFLGKNEKLPAPWKAVGNSDLMMFVKTGD